MADLRLATWEVAEHSAGTIHLGIGQPHRSLLPTALLSQAVPLMLAEQDERHVLQYSANAGCGPFLQALAAFLSHHYAFPLISAELFTTNGCSQALELACQCFARAGDAIWVEEPAYHYVHSIFADNGLAMSAVPQHADGALDVDVLEDMLRAAHTPPRLLYLIPSFNNPTGATLSAAKRERLVQLAKTFGFKILSDEVYQLLFFNDSDRPPPSLARFAHLAGCPEHVLSLGSFSKLIGPGLRLGWIHSAPSVVDQLASRGFVNSGGGLNPLASSLVQAMMGGGRLDRHLQWLREQLQCRAAKLAEALRTAAGNSVSAVHTPVGGYFLWLRLRADIDASKVLERAAARGVRFLPGPRFSHTQSARLQSCLRLSFAFYAPAELETAGRVLGEVMREVYEEACSSK